MRSAGTFAPVVDDLAGDLVAEHAAGLAARDLAAAREHVVIADAGRMDAHQHVVRARLRPLDDWSPCSTDGAPKSANVTAFIDAMVTYARLAKADAPCLKSSFDSTRSRMASISARSASDRRCGNSASRLVACTATGE